LQSHGRIDRGSVIVDDGFGERMPDIIGVSSLQEGRLLI
jgi:hypothetical protein